MGVVLLEQYRWKNRILIIFSHDTGFMEEQKRILKNVRSGLVDRDMILFGFDEDNPPFISKESLNLETLQESLSIRDDSVVLLGKDGYVKATWESIVDPRIIFDIIDAMPMRQREMRERGK